MAAAVGETTKRFIISNRELIEINRICEERKLTFSDFVRDAIRQKVIGFTALDELKQCRNEILELRNEINVSVSSARLNSLEDNRQQHELFRLLMEQFEELAIHAAQSNSRQIAELCQWAKTNLEELSIQQSAKFDEVKDLNIKSIQLIAQKFSGQPVQEVQKPSLPNHLTTFDQKFNEIRNPQKQKEK